MKQHSHMIEERRIARSERAEEALHLFLDSALKKLGVETLIVADEDGELIAGVGDAPGFVAGLAAKVDAGLYARCDLATWRIAVGERSFVIGSLGARVDFDLGEGVRRILS